MHRLYKKKILFKFLHINNNHLCIMLLFLNISFHKCFLLLFLCISYNRCNLFVLTSVHLLSHTSYNKCVLPCKNHNYYNKCFVFHINYSPSFIASRCYINKYNLSPSLWASSTMSAFHPCPHLSLYSHWVRPPPEGIQSLGAPVQ